MMSPSDICAALNANRYLGIEAWVYDAAKEEFRSQPQVGVDSADVRVLSHNFAAKVAEDCLAGAKPTAEREPPAMEDWAGAAMLHLLGVLAEKYRLPEGMRRQIHEDVMELYHHGRTPPAWAAAADELKRRVCLVHAPTLLMAVGAQVTYIDHLQDLCDHHKRRELEGLRRAANLEAELDQCKRTIRDLRREQAKREPGA